MEWLASDEWVSHILKAQVKYSSAALTELVRVASHTYPHYMPRRPAAAAAAAVVVKQKYGTTPKVITICLTFMY